MNLLDKTELEKLRVAVDAYQYYIGEDLTNGISVLARYAKAFLEVAPLLDEQVDENGLKPCPFCGGEAIIERYGGKKTSTLYCCLDCACSLETGETFNHGNRWNTRADKTAKVVKELEERKNEIDKN